MSPRLDTMDTARRPQRRGPRPAPQPPGRGVAARGHAAVGGRHRRRRRRASPRPTSTSRPTATSSTPSPRSTPPASRPTRSRWPTSCAGPACSTPSAARPPSLRSCSVHAGHLQRRALRPHRRGARAAAPAHRRGRRDRRARLRRARRRAEGRRPGRVLVFEVAERRVTDTIAAPSTCSTEQPRPPRAALRAGRRDHRHAHRLPRPRRAPRRACSRAPSSSSAPVPPWARPPSPSAWPPTPRCERRPARAVLLARDEPARAHPAARCAPRPRVDSKHAPQRQAHRAPTGRRSATRSAGWPRRRSGSTTTPTSRSWRSAPRPAG